MALGAAADPHEIRPVSKISPDTPCSRYDGYFEEVARRISAALTDETREAILRLKWETLDTEKIAGIEYYMAVLRDGIRSYPDFVRWREAHPLTGVAEWMP